MGFGGFNLQGLMKQAQIMQEDMMKAQEELENTNVEATVGGGMVTVIMNGKKDIQKIKLAKEVVDPEDIEMLEDLIVAGLKEASKKADELYASKMPSGINGLL